MKSPIDVENIYREYTDSISETNRAEIKSRLDQDKTYYRASSAGMCLRKLYYESVLKLEPSEVYADKTMRIFRLGDLIHTDLQNAMVMATKRKEPKETI